MSFRPCFYLLPFTHYPKSHKFGVFLEFKDDFKGNLSLTAFDSKGLKQDVSELKVEEKAGKAKVYLFKFEYFEPGLSGYCVITRTN